MATVSDFKLQWEPKTRCMILIFKWTAAVDVPALSLIAVFLAVQPVSVSLANSPVVRLSNSSRLLPTYLHWSRSQFLCCLLIAFLTLLAITSTHKSSLFWSEQHRHRLLFPLLLSSAQFHLTAFCFSLIELQMPERCRNACNNLQLG